MAYAKTYNRNDLLNFLRQMDAVRLSSVRVCIFVEVEVQKADNAKRCDLTTNFVKFMQQI